MYAIGGGAADDNQVAVDRVIPQPALCVVGTEEKEIARALGPSGHEGGSQSGRHDAQGGEPAGGGAVIVRNDHAIEAGVGCYEIGQGQGCVGGGNPGDLVRGQVVRVGEIQIILQRAGSGGADCEGDIDRKS